MSEGPKRTQITLKSFLLSTSFIGAGIGCFLAGNSYLNSPTYENWRGILALVQILAAAPLIGAGIFRPFGRARLGAYVGFFLFMIAGGGHDTYHFGWNAI
jgi:hypothetical protein